MKRIVLLLALTFTFLAAPARARYEISFDFFYDNLSPYGEWSEVGGYGTVWHPSGVDEDWAPYTDGYWSYTDAGWTWVSYEDGGGICYHYGRWVQVDDYGWCWVPDYEWGPAWVSWRKSDRYVGWAPLPPEAHWRRETGFGAWVDTHFDIGPLSFRFCNVEDFGAPVLRHVFLPRTRNVVFINETVNITNISYRSDSGYAFNGGLDYAWIAPRCRYEVPALKLVHNTTNIFINGNKGNVFINAQKGNQLIMAAPPLAAAHFNVLSKKPVLARTIAKPVVSRGWAGMDKEGVRDRLLVKMREDTKGLTPETAPARAVKPEQLTIVPKKANPNAKLPSLLKAHVPAAPLAHPVAETKDANGDGIPDRAKPVPGDRNGDGIPDAPKHPVAKPAPGDRNGDGVPDHAKPVVPADANVESKPGGLRPARPHAAPADQNDNGNPSEPKRPVEKIKPNDRDGDGIPNRAQPVVPTQPEIKPQPESKPHRLIVPREDRNDDTRKAEAAREQAGRAAQQHEAAIAKRQNEAAASERALEQQHAAQQQRAAESAQRQRMIDEAKQQQSAEKQRRQSAENEGARHAAEAQRAAQENARRDAIENRRHSAVDAQRQQQAEAARARASEAAQQRAVENARRQAPPERVLPPSQPVQPGNSTDDVRKKRKKDKDAKD